MDSERDAYAVYCTYIARTVCDTDVYEWWLMDAFMSEKNK